VLCHDSLANIFQTNFAMVQHHKYSFTEIENMMPWERDIYINMLVDHVEKENEKVRQEQAKMNRRR
tara:strand:- start:112 stop:309 length:198 start_codon:yes stop_codon:yes gene_type:complete